MGQQCLSILEQREGAFTRIQDFADDLATLPHLDRPAVELILAELASKGLCQRHGYKNQYGASDGLWELSEQGMLFGNFPLGSRTVDLRHGKRLLGSVPRLNLLRVHQGDVIRFAGRRWSVSALRPDGVHIEPSNARRHDVDLSYGGSGRDGLDFFLTNNIWALIFTLTEQTSDMDHPTWEALNQCLAAVREACTADSLPLTRTPQGTRYYTFGGTALNKVLARWAGGQALHITDTYIEIDHSIDWSGIPMTTLDLLPAARPPAAPTGSQTLFQKNLPADFQERELSEAWLKDEEIPHVLHRLRAAAQVPVPEGLFQFMAIK
jgi:ATP-dependent Lhr-like helicase